MSLLQDILSVFLPCRCWACGEILVAGEDKLCIDCNTRLMENKINDYERTQLRTKLPMNALVVDMLSVFHYTNTSISGKFIRRFKYGKEVYLGKWLGDMLCQELKETEWINKIDYVIPMPLHPLRHIWRGFNQSEVLARQICRVFPNVRLCKDIKRVRYKAHQTRSGKEERYNNIEGVFTLKNVERFGGKSVLLVDDVITTGASLSGCVRVLSCCKDIKIYVDTIAATYHQ